MSVDLLKHQQFNNNNNSNSNNDNKGNDVKSHQFLNNSKNLTKFKGIPEKHDRNQISTPMNNSRLLTATFPILTLPPLQNKRTDPNSLNGVEESIKLKNVCLYESLEQFFKIIRTGDLKNIRQDREFLRDQLNINDTELDIILRNVESTYVTYISSSSQHTPSKSSLVAKVRRNGGVKTTNALKLSKNLVGQIIKEGSFSAYHHNQSQIQRSPFQTSVNIFKNKVTSLQPSTNYMQSRSLPSSAMNSSNSISSSPFRQRAYSQQLSTTSEGRNSFINTTNPYNSNNINNRATSQYSLKRDTNIVGNESFNNNNNKRASSQQSISRKSLHKVSSAPLLTQRPSIISPSHIRKDSLSSLSLSSPPTDHHTHNIPIQFPMSPSFSNIHLKSHIKGEDSSDDDDFHHRTVERVGDPLLSQSFNAAINVTNITNMSGSFYDNSFLFADSIISQGGSNNNHLRKLDSRGSRSTIALTRQPRKNRPTTTTTTSGIGSIGLGQSNSTILTQRKSTRINTKESFFSSTQNMNTYNNFRINQNQKRHTLLTPKDEKEYLAMQFMNSIDKIKSHTEKVYYFYYFLYNYIHIVNTYTYTCCSYKYICKLFIDMNIHNIYTYTYC